MTRFLYDNSHWPLRPLLGEEGGRQRVILIVAHKPYWGVYLSIRAFGRRFRLTVGPRFSVSPKPRFE